VAHPVIELIRARQASGSKPLQRTDPHRLALLVEGGCMRGVVTGAMLGALEALGLKDVFDVVYGSSAGAANAAYFVSGQLFPAATIYFKHVNNRKFIDPLRILRHQPIADFDYVFDYVMGTVVEIDWQAVVTSPIPLRVLATDVALAKTVVLDNFQSKEELLRAMHASARMPWLSRSPLLFRHRLYWDAGLLDPFCIKTALAEGSTHVLILCGQPGGLIRKEPKVLKGRVAANLAHYNREVAWLYLANFDPSESGAAKALRSENDPTTAPYLMHVAPLAGVPRVHDLEVRTAYLLAGARAGIRSMVATLGYPAKEAEKIIEKFEYYRKSGR
jgi:predicted patatin/cPLA2 family phospholipase